jgi:hypothetical protein
MTNLEMTTSFFSFIFLVAALALLPLAIVKIPSERGVVIAWILYLVFGFIGVLIVAAIGKV